MQMLNTYERLIDEIEQYLKSCKKAAFSSNSITVDRTKIEEMLLELRKKTPEEIKRCIKMNHNYNRIIQEAKQEASRITESAAQEKETFIMEHEIVKEANAQRQMILEQAQEVAKQIIDEAVLQADGIKENMVCYTDDTLMKIQEILQNSLNTTTSHYEHLAKALSDKLNLVVENRKELHQQSIDEVEKMEVSDETHIPIDFEEDDEY